MTQSAESIRKTIFDLTSERGQNKTICPSEVARKLQGSDEKMWRLLMKPIRQEAVDLAQSGQIVITRKGKPVDPHNFKGVYRIAMAGYTGKNGGTGDDDK
jgi:hypothetical protein